MDLPHHLIPDTCHLEVPSKVGAEFNGGNVLYTRRRNPRVPLRGAAPDPSEEKGVPLYDRLRPAGPFRRTEKGGADPRARGRERRDQPSAGLPESWGPGHGIGAPGRPCRHGRAQYLHELPGGTESISSRGMSATPPSSWNPVPRMLSFSIRPTGRWGRGN